MRSPLPTPPLPLRFVTPDSTSTPLPSASKKQRLPRSSPVPVTSPPSTLSGVGPRPCPPTQGPLVIQGEPATPLREGLRVCGRHSRPPPPSHRTRLLTRTPLRDTGRRRRDPSTAMLPGDPGAGGRRRRLGLLVNPVPTRGPWMKGGGVFGGLQDVWGQDRVSLRLDLCFGRGDYSHLLRRPVTGRTSDRPSVRPSPGLQVSVEPKGVSEQRPVTLGRQSGPEKRGDRVLLLESGVSGGSQGGWESHPTAPHPQPSVFLELLPPTLQSPRFELGVSPRTRGSPTPGS